jgi:UDP-N-acetyl-2-amino-2-deoxyglucuronate dehydrogenase
MQTIRFGLIGVGNITPMHAAAIRGTPGAELVAVATRSAERGRAFAAEHDAAWHADYRELLARADVDAVGICTPPDLHAPMTIDAAEAGKHVICEKPMARTTDECDAMIGACRKAGVQLGVIFQGRFEPLARQLKGWLEAGKLGRLLWTSTATPWYRPESYYQSGAWRGKLIHEGGGVLINQAIHAIDLMLWLGGTPARVMAQARTLNHRIEIEDCAAAILEYADGRLGLIQATTNAFPGYPERLEFHGTNGSAVYHKGQGRLEWHLIEPREDGEEATGASSGAARPMDISAAGHTAQYQDFVAAVREGRPPLVDGHEGRRSLELVQAVYRSAETGAAAELA